MQFEHRYFGHTAVKNAVGQTSLSFAPDTRRAPTFFRGELDLRLPFREGISALHDVVVSDLRFKPKDRTAYFEWRARQDDLELNVDQLDADRAEVSRQLQVVDRLRDLEGQISKRSRAFYAARQRYFDHLYRHDLEAWTVLDPVITVHPDEIFFECFSEDESSYGRLACGYDVFGQVGELACGTTNIDYSAHLYDEFQKIRGYKTTSLVVDPTGFEVATTGEADYREQKIDVPDSWVRGFLQVSSAMTLPGVRFCLHPMDVFNFCSILRRRRERQGPRSMRYRLTPGRPVQIRFEPWNLDVTCHRSIYPGDQAHEIRVWGRRRIHLLERLIPVAKRFEVTLLGTGMPSFYVADLGEMSFTLGLSGWTANDWSRQGNFDLLAPRAHVDGHTKQAVFDALKQTWFADEGTLARTMGLDPAVVTSALAAWTQAGRVMRDLHRGVYRVRELSQEPLPLEALRWSNERESQAHDLVASGAVTVLERASSGGEARVSGLVRWGTRQESCSVRINPDERLVGGDCTCSFHFANRLRQGPCAHLIALRIAFGRSRR